MATTYKSAGVDISAGESAVERIKSLVKGTFNKNVLGGIGHFGSFYQLDLSGYKSPVLVSSVDGVGTKLKIAFMMNEHNTVGQDLVNHCVNDIAVCGAKPLYFMDYLAFGKLVPEKFEAIVKGFSIACRENKVALIGGETAEMPDFYKKEEYDISGTIVGVVDKEKILDGKNIQKGDILIGFPSSGLHTNGYSLARKVLLKKYDLFDHPESLDGTLGQELLKIHRSYLKIISKLKKYSSVRAFSHITGGGIIGNTKRVIPSNLSISINWKAWEIPPVFRLIQTTGKIDDEEMRKVFNLGIGLISVVKKKSAEKILQTAKINGEKAFIMGEVI